MCEKPCYKRCPKCGVDLVAIKKNEEETLARIVEQQREAAPEVARDWDPQDGCENLAPPKLKPEEELSEEETRRLGSHSDHDEPPHFSASSRR